MNNRVDNMRDFVADDELDILDFMDRYLSCELVSHEQTVLYFNGA